MKYIANVITKSDKYKFNDLIKICSEYSNTEKNIPTLIVGIENAKKYVFEKTQ
jgi:hypothetical protein